jgi:hypothetical protein
MGNILLHMKQNVGTRYLHILQMKTTEQELLMLTMEINGHCASELSLSLWKCPKKCQAYVEIDSSDSETGPFRNYRHFIVLLFYCKKGTDEITDF